MDTKIIIIASTRILTGGAGWWENSEDLLPGCGARPVDTVLYNGAVYTVDAESSWADAVVVKDGKITFVGGNADALAEKQAGMTSIDQ
jgi:hypothetical protein